MKSGEAETVKSETREAVLSLAFFSIGFSDKNI
jgi:hypothetical protein